MGRSVVPLDLLMIAFGSERCMFGTVRVSLSRLVLRLLVKGAAADLHTDVDAADLRTEVDRGSSMSQVTH